MVGSRPVLRSFKMASDDEFKINENNKNNVWVRQFPEDTGSNNNEISGSKSTQEECRTKLLDAKDMDLFGSCPYDDDVYLVVCSCNKLAFHIQTFKSHQNNHKCLTQMSSKADNIKLSQSTNQSKRDSNQQKNAKDQKVNASRTKHCNIKNPETFYEHQRSSHYIAENGLQCPESQEPIFFNGVDLCEYASINKISDVKQQNSHKSSKRGRKPGKSKRNSCTSTKNCSSNVSNPVEFNEESVDPQTPQENREMNGSSPLADSAYGSEKSANCPSNSPSMCEISRSEICNSQKSEICNSHSVYHCDFQNASHLEIPNCSENKEITYSKSFLKRKNDSREIMDEGRKRNKRTSDNLQKEDKLENFSTYSDSCYQLERLDGLQSLADDTKDSTSSCDQQEGGNLQNLSSSYTKENKLLPCSTENYFPCDTGQSEAPLPLRTDSDNVNQTCASSSTFQNSSEDLEQMEVFLDKTSESCEKTLSDSDTAGALKTESTLPCSDSFLEKIVDEEEVENETEDEEESSRSSCSSSDSCEEDSSSDESSSNEDGLCSVKSMLFPPRVLMKNKKYSKYGTMLLDSVPQFKLGAVIDIQNAEKDRIMETEKPSTSKPETPAVTTCPAGVLTEENSQKDNYPLSSNCRNEDRTPSKSLFQTQITRDNHPSTAPYTNSISKVLGVSHSNAKYSPYSYLLDSIGSRIFSKQINSPTVINKQFNEPFKNVPANSSSTSSSTQKNCINTNHGIFGKKGSPKKVKVNGLINPEHSPDKV